MHLPGPVRAAVGLLATAAEEARNLPDRAVELPMLAVSTALQASLRVQQRYAALAAKGDEALSRRRPTDEPPEWATFDEPVPAQQLQAALGDPQDTRSAAELLDQLFGAVPEGDPRDDGRRAAAARKTAAAKKAAAKKAAAARKAATAAARRSAAATDAESAGTPADAPSAEPAAKSTAKAAKKAAKKAAGTAAKKAAANSATKSATESAAKSAPKPARTSDKSINSPRHTAPSRFDTVVEPDTDTDTDD